MGTFHDDRGELHGITVAVESADGDLWIGRCDTAEGEQVILLDADVHRGSDETERRAYLERAARFGVWAKHPRVALAKAGVRSIRRLGDLGGD